MKIDHSVVFYSSRRKEKQQELDEALVCVLKTTTYTHFCSTFDTISLLCTLYLPWSAAILYYTDGERSVLDNVTAALDHNYRFESFSFKVNFQTNFMHRIIHTPHILASQFLIVENVLKLRYSVEQKKVEQTFGAPPCLA